ncbi:peptidylprolyl isomerase [Chloroflexota bacterium]
MTGCAGKEGTIVASDGDTVRVHYTGTLDDGTMFDTSRESEPLEFTLGGGGIISGFEDAVRGMAVGETKTVTIPSDEAYGPHYSDLLITIERAQIPEDLVKIGQQIPLQRTDGSTTTGVITSILEDSVTIDANHPLAGKDLIFEIKLVEIQ